MKADGQPHMCTGSCGQEYPATEEFFYKNGQGKLFAKCINCYGDVVHNYTTRPERQAQRQIYDHERRKDPVIRSLNRMQEWEYQRHLPQLDPVAQIYVLKSAGLYKIGFTTKLSERLSCYRSHSALPINLIGLCDGTLEAERCLHWQFKDHRDHGEWYVLLPEQLIELQAAILANDNASWDEGALIICG